jgi:hypothetical protein
MQRILLLLVVLCIYTTALAAAEGSIRITGKVWESTKVSQHGSQLNIVSSTATKSPQFMTLSSETNTSKFILNSPSIELDFKALLQQETELLTLSITTL